MSHDATRRNERYDCCEVHSKAEAKRHALNLRQCAIFAADVGKHIAQSMTDAADFLDPPEEYKCQKCGAGPDERYDCCEVHAMTETVASKQHDLYKTGDFDAPGQIKDRNGEVVLSMCRKCGRAEIELSEPCNPKE